MTAGPASPPPDLAAEAGACRVRKRPVTMAVAFPVADGVVETLEGAVRYAAGDAILTGVRGERWPVQREAFAASYDPVPPTEPWQPGAYVKRPQTALALRLRSVITVPVGQHGDPLRGGPGDWLLQYEDGRRGVVCDEIFRATYERLEPLPKGDEQ